MPDENIFQPTLEGPRTRVDRPATPEEAAAKDEAHRRSIAEQRASRFRGEAPPRKAGEIEKEIERLMEDASVRDIRDDLARLRHERERAEDFERPGGPAPKRGRAA